MKSIITKNNDHSQVKDNDNHSYFNIKGLFDEIKNLPKYSTDEICLEGLVTDISIDAEWDRFDNKFHRYLNGDNKIETMESVSHDMLTKQATLYFDNGYAFTMVLIEDDLAPLSVLDYDAIKKWCNTPVMIIPCDVNRLNCSQIIISKDIKLDKKVNVHMFYATLDLLVLMDRSALLPLCMGGKDALISSKRNKSGTFNQRAAFPVKDAYEKEINSDSLDDDFSDIEDELAKYHKGTTFKIVDSFGMRNTSLDNCLKSVGIKNDLKEWAEKQDKSQMRKVFQNDPVTSIIYAVRDAELLIPYRIAHTNTMNKIISDALGFNPGFDIDNIPGTVGKLVAVTFEKWLAVEYPSLMSVVDTLACVPEASDKKYAEYLAQIYDKNNDLEKIKVGRKEANLEHVYKVLMPDNLENGDCVAGLGSASSIYFASQAGGYARYNALLYGGRCVNEAWFEFIVNGVIDPDISGCYGGCLRAFLYPIGRPSVLQSDNTHEFTVGEIMNPRGKYRKNLIPGLWQMVVDIEKLSFKQDLIFSKLNVDGDKISSKVESDFKNSTIHEKCFAIDGFERDKTSGDFALLKKQIKNGIITNFSWNILEKTCSRKELAEVKKAKVLTIAYYSKKDRVKSEEEMVSILRNPKNTKNAKVAEGKDIIDRRTTKWFGVPLSGFIGSFIDYRGELKSKKKQFKDSDPELSETFDLQQNSVKLFINTLYGCLASPYFSFSNIILANNITDNARCAVWQMSKALGCVQNITDGGMFSADHVRRLKTENNRLTAQKPTFSTFADFRAIDKHKYIEIISILDFEKLYHKDLVISKYYPEETDLDSLLMTHVKDFWSYYDLDFTVDIECKQENTSLKSVYLNSSDYLLINPKKSNEEELPFDLVIRSDQDLICYYYSIKVRGAKQKDHPKKLILFYLAGMCGKPETEFVYSQMVGFNEWVTYLDKEMSKNKFYGLLPGDEVIKKTRLTLLLKQIPVNNEYEWKHRNQIHRQRKSSRLRFGTPESVAEDPDLINNLLNYLEYGDSQFIQSQAAFKRELNKLDRKN